MKNITAQWLATLIGVAVLAQLAVGWWTGSNSSFSLAMCLTNLTLSTAAYVAVTRSQHDGISRHPRVMLAFYVIWEGLCLLAMCAIRLID